MGFAQNVLPFRGKVNSDNINIRADSSIGSEVVSKANANDIVETVAERYDWYKIRLPKDARVYINEELVKLIESPEPATPAEDKLPGQAKVTANNVNIRLKPSLESRIVGKADYDQIVEVTEKKDGWYKIVPISSCYGWINKKFVDEANQAPAPADREELVVSAAAVMEEGKPAFEIRGNIQPYWKLFGGPGTHKLICKDGKAYILKGDKELMDSFNNTDVLISGEIISDADKKKPLVLLKSLEAAE